MKKGDHVEFNVIDDKLIIKPVTVIPKSQVWFWSEQWQNEEKEADEDIKTGKVAEIENEKELKGYLDYLKGNNR